MRRNQRFAQKLAKKRSVPGYPESYDFSEINKQEEMLRRQLAFSSPKVLADAIRRMHKRVLRFYGFDNKYDGTGYFRR